MSVRSVLPILLGALGSFGVAEEARPPRAGETPAGAASSETPTGGARVRMCFGGLQDGKVVVETSVKDGSAETTKKRCGIDGGMDARAPRSPRIAARRFRALA